MSWVAVTCSSCGGAVNAVVGERLPLCLFCGSASIEEQTVEEEIEVPESILEFAVDEAGARDAFAAFATSSIWYPNDLRRATLDLNPLYLPAWLWSGHIETHYTALVRANSPSGKRPVSGSDHLEMRGILVPSSSAIRRAELTAICPYDGARARRFDPREASAPYELGRLTRSAARAEAEGAMRSHHRQQLVAAVGALHMNCACLFRDLSGRPLLIPVYIGAYRRGRKLYRVVINGQTGKLTGKAPISILKVISVVVAVVFGGAWLLFCIALVMGLLGAGVSMAP